MASEVIDKLNKETISAVCETSSIISDIYPQVSLRQKKKKKMKKEKGRKIATVTEDNEVSLTNHNMLYPLA